MKCSEEGQRLGVTTLRWGPNWGSLSCRPPCSNSAWWTVKESECKESHLIERGGENVLRLVLTFKSLYYDIAQRSPMFPCLAFPGVSILHMMGWYVITPRKLLLTKYNELDNKSYLDLTSFTCTFFFLIWGWGEGSQRYGIHSLRTCSTSSQGPNGQCP